MRPMLAALAALALLAIPSVAGDHVYSHRFIVDGRLIGSDGLPLPGRTMELTSEGEDFLEPCREGMHPITDEFGDWDFCYHHHELAPTAKITVRYGNASATRAVDIATRRVPIHLQEPNETGVAIDAWARTYRISGRAWTPGPMKLEGVQVFGEAVAALPVNLTVHFEDGSDQVFHSVTNGYGDYDLIVETEADPRNLSLSVEAKGRSQPTQLDALYHRAYAPVYLTSSAQGNATAPTGDGFTPIERPGAPGNTTPRINPVLVVAVALGLVAAIVLSRRKGA